MASGVLFYALGGGLGHVTRARAAALTLGIPEESINVLTPIKEIEDTRVAGRMRGVRPPEHLEHDRDGLRAWVTEALDTLRPELVVVDTFPAGILGELEGIEIPRGATTLHLARRLRWNAYAPLITVATDRFLRPPPSRCATTAATGSDGIGMRFQCVYRLEELEPDHESYLRRNSNSIETLDLLDPSIDVGEAENRIIAALREGPRPLWIIVHSGSNDEIRELVRVSYSRHAAVDAQRGSSVSPPRVVVVSPHGAPDGMEHVDMYPASLLFPIADRIITAGGFNVMRQLEPYRDRHVAIPLHRRFDDQQWRVGARQAISISPSPKSPRPSS